jgi:hypothetical protein
MCPQQQNHREHSPAGKVASLPFRFKAGGNMAPIAAQHHHRSTTKQTQKSFKSRHATKGSIKELAKGTFLKSRHVSCL